MRIVMYGNFSVDFTSETHYAKTLEAMGHEVIRLQENTVRTEEVLRRCKFAHMFVWIHSHGFANKGYYRMAQILNELRRIGVPSVGYHLDLYMGLERWKEYENHEYFKVEYFFTVDKLMADWLNENTNTKAHYIMPGVFAPECYIAEPNQTKHDVVFTGSKGYHPEWPYRPELVNFLESNYKSFGHYGGDGIKVVRGDELNAVYASSKVTVGDTLNLNFNYPFYSSDRFFEAIGRGAFLIYPKIEGFAEDYIDGEHVVYYKHGDLQDLKKKIDYYLKHDKEREKIRLAGHELTKTKHTYTQRWQEMIGIVFNGTR